MKVIDYRKEDKLILTMKGNLDEITSEIFQKKLLAFIEKGELKIILDCSKLEYISSGGIRVFYLAANVLEEKKGKLVFAALSPRIRKLFDIVEMEDDFEIYSDLENALSNFG